METLLQNKTQQLSTISIMLDYDIDNTLNTIKENAMTSYFPSVVKAKTLHGDNAKTEINNNTKTVCNPNHHQGQDFLKTTARKRWKILAKALRKDSEEDVTATEINGDVMASVRRFKSFDLLQQDTMPDDIQTKMIGKPENWYTYRISFGPYDYCVNIHHIARQLTAADLMGFNNTGNICVWPSEEALTVYCLADINNFHNKWILELGGGMTCLSGLMIAKYAKPYAVHLTDGNHISVENVRRTTCLNDLSCYTKCSILKWEDTARRQNSEREKFDYILSADCLFFDEARSVLVDTIWFYLARSGVALVMAPQRGQTLANFVERCTNQGFICQIVHRYSEIIWQRHVELQLSELYDENIHYPVLIKLTKPNTSDD